eukprot:3147938-Alexandrium_andersonii.AAC.1
MAGRGPHPRPGSREGKRRALFTLSSERQRRPLTYAPAVNATTSTQQCRKLQRAETCRKLHEALVGSLLQFPVLPLHAGSVMVFGRGGQRCAICEQHERHGRCSITGPRT